MITTTEIQILKLLVDNDVSTVALTDISTEALMQETKLSKETLLKTLKKMHISGYFKDYAEGGNFASSVFICLSTEAARIVRGQKE